MEKRKLTPAEKRIKIISPIIAGFILLILFGIKAQNPTFALKYILIVAGVIIAIASMAFWSVDILNKFNLLKKENSNKKFPDPVSSDLLWQKAKYCLTNEIYRDHIKKIEKIVNHSVGKNKKSLVVEFVVRTLNNYKMQCHILFNANYPNRMPTVLFEPTIYELNKAIQGMSFDPEDPANEEETVIRNEMTGVTSTTKKKNYHSNEKKETKPVSEPLI